MKISLIARGDFLICPFLWELFKKKPIFGKSDFCLFKPKYGILVETYKTFLGVHDTPISPHVTGRTSSGRAKILIHF